MILTILNALIAIPKIAGYIEAFASQVTLWYVQHAQNQTLQAISDAAALGARAQSDADRYAVAAAWQAALSSNRVSSN